MDTSGTNAQCICSVCSGRLREEASKHIRKEETMATKRMIEIFSAGCSVCRETIEMIQRVVCPSCEVTILDRRDPAIARQAESFRIRSVPAVVIDGTLADCCAGRGPDEATLRAVKG
jgi:hypothetical protein